MHDPLLTRRDALQAAAAVSAVGLAGADAALAQAGGESKPPAPPADLPRELAPSAANLGTLFEPVAQLAAERPFSLSFLGDRFKTLDEFKTAARAKVFEVLLYEPAKVVPKPEVVASDDMGDYVREKVVFSTSPIFRVPAYVLIPKGVKKPAPAIVDLHSHGGMFLFGKEKVTDLGANHPAMAEYHRRNYDGRPTATELVRRGYVVISIDAFMFGERRALADAEIKTGWDRAKYNLETVTRLNQFCRAKESTIVKSLIYSGLTWPGIVFWDDIRTVDYLAGRPEVDAKRIGCLGISMGGWRTLFLTGLDERIAAAVVVGFMSTVRPMIKAHMDTHSFVHFVPTLHRYLDLSDVVGMSAPRALMVQQCERDALFPPAGMKESVEKIGAIFAKAGCSEKFAGRFYDAPHQFTRPMQDEAFAWLDRHLKG